MPRSQDIHHALEREFAVLVLEWDGTAIADLRARPGALRGRLERLTALGVDVAVVGTVGGTRLEVDTIVDVSVRRLRAAASRLAPVVPAGA